eukprot:m.138258 g.138258  ORF g.138258 m.138258 type:complete len:398 (-) comp14008_c1_seq15:55-1248(-)
MLHRLSRCLSQCRVPSRASSSSVLYSWGASTATGCGTGRTADDGAEGSITVPGRISLPEPQMEPIKVAMGYAHSAVIVKGVDSIQLLVSGINTSYQLGADKEQIVDYFEPMRVPGDPIDVDCGRNHTILLSTEGLFSIGSDHHGQCGLGGETSPKQWAQVPNIDPSSIKQVVCGLDHTLLLLNDGTVMAAGWGADGQTGMGHLDDTLQFERIPGITNAIKVASSADTTLVLHEDGTVSSFGNSEYGQTGHGCVPDQRPSPSLIDTTTPVQDIASGGAYSMLLCADGSIVKYGVPFATDLDLANVPTTFTLPTQPRDIFAGGRHLLVATDDCVYAWGNTGAGSVGLDRETTDFHQANSSGIARVNTPVPILEGALIDAACGTDATLVILREPSCNSSA